MFEKDGEGRPSVRRPRRFHCRGGSTAAGGAGRGKAGPGGGGAERMPIS